MGRGPKWSDGDLSRIIALRKEGIMFRVIADYLGRSVGATKNKAIETGITDANHSTPRGPRNTKIAKAVNAAYGGKESASQVAERLGISRNSVCSYWARARRDGVVEAKPSKFNPHTMQAK